MVQEAGGLRSVELAGQRARDSPLGKRVDVTAAVSQRMELQLPVAGDRVGTIGTDHLIELQPIRQLPDRVRQRNERSVGNDRPTPGQQLQSVRSAG